MSERNTIALELALIHKMNHKLDDPIGRMNIQFPPSAGDIC
jgi:hypothetical protein